MKRLLLLFIFLPVPLKASPITGAFTTGTMNSTTTTKQTIVESIVSKDYNSGYTYSVSGTGVELQDSGSMIPSAVQTNGTTDGVSYSWTGLDFSTKPTFKQTENGAAFQLTESYMGVAIKCDNNKSNNRSRKHSSNAVNLSKIALLILLSPTSVLANAVSQSNTGSVTNQNYNVNNGSFHTNQYGGNIVCQGAQMNITPFSTFNTNYPKTFFTFL